MAHYANIGDTAREITGGKVNINGTAREIVKGKTLINGTAYDILFKPKTVTITIKHSRWHSAGSFSVNGTKYTDKVDESTEVIEVPVGSTLSATVNFNTHGGCGIYYNGEAPSGGGRSMTITIVRNTVVEFESTWYDDGSASDKYYSYVRITD